jgi:hypothetical protein
MREVSKKKKPAIGDEDSEVLSGASPMVSSPNCFHLQECFYSELWSQGGARLSCLVASK